ncbi:10710_t:CDS:1, partial [Racocetra persica]
NSQEQQLAERFLKKLVEAELYLERKQSNSQIVSELLQLKKDYPNIYQLFLKITSQGTNLTRWR